MAARGADPPSPRLRPDRHDAGEGREAGASSFCATLFDCEGIQTEIVCPAPGRCNLLARLPGKTREGALLLLNHVDVVERVPVVLEGGAAFRGPHPARLPVRPRRLRHEVASGSPQALALREVKRRGIVPRDGHPLPRRGRRGDRAEVGLALAARAPPGVVRGRALGDQRGGHDRADPALAPLLGRSRRSRRASRRPSSRSPRARPSRRWRRRSRSSKSEPVAASPAVVEGFDMLANHLPESLHGSAAPPRSRPHGSRPSSPSCPTATRASWRPGSTGPSLYALPRQLRAGCADTRRSPSPPGVAPRPYLDPILPGGPRRRSGSCRSSTAVRRSASDYPTGLTDLLQRVTEAHYPGVPFGPAARVRRLHDLAALPEPRLRDLRLLALRDEHHGYRSSATGTTSASTCATTCRGVRLFTDVLLEYALFSAQ